MLLVTLAGSLAHPVGELRVLTLPGGRDTPVSAPSASDPEVAGDALRPRILRVAEDHEVAARFAWIRPLASELHEDLLATLGHER